MKLSGLSIGAIFLLTAMFSEIAVAQHHIQFNYLSDIDQDDDGSIELCDLNALDTVHYQLDGSGYRGSSDAVKITADCPQSGCNGFELRSDLVLSQTNIKGASHVGNLAGHNAGGGKDTYVSVWGDRLISAGNNMNGLFGVKAETTINGNAVLSITSQSIL